MGSITTFYSYKGGVGRTMALANVAVLLARKRMRVLMIDWDLEAPGLERYFSDFEPLSNGRGLLSMCQDFIEAGNADYADYISAFDLGDGNQIWLLSSGREHDPNYSRNLESFDWNSFFSESRGGDFLERLRRDWRREFNFTLIDSRTGLSDTGGICTIQLPDIVVAMFSANHQSIYGVRDVMQLVQEARQNLAYDRMRLTVLPLPARLGATSELSEAQIWVRKIAEAFSEFYGDWLPTGVDVTGVVQQLKVPQIDYFGFGEKLAVVDHGISDPQGLGFIYNKVAELIENDFQNVEKTLTLTQQRKPQQDDRAAISSVDDLPSRRSQGINRSSGGYAYDIYVSYTRDQLTSDWIKQFMDRVVWRLRQFSGGEVTVFYDVREIEVGELWHLAISKALSRSKILMAFLTQRYFASSWTVAEWRTFEQRENLTGGAGFPKARLILPLRLHGGANYPESAQQRQMYDVREYFHASPRFWDSPKAFDLETNVIVPVSEVIHEMLATTPVLDSTWPIIDPSDPQVESVLRSSNTPPVISGPRSF